MNPKRLLVIVVILVVLGLSLPISNLLVGLPENTLSTADIEDPVFARAVEILSHKCVNCHTPEYRLPFYANFPIAKGIITQDIEDGTAYINYLEELFPPDGQPVGEVVLAKTEQTLIEGSMPPHRYLALHWNGGLRKAEKEDLQKWIYDVRAKNYATPGAAPQFANEIAQRIPEDGGADPRKAALGDALYHDTRLSKDNTISCASCHDLGMGGTDQAQFSTGVDGAMGDINAPTTFNAGWQFLHFWDGRAADLEEQADGPVNNPIEMASSWDEAIPKLEADAEFTAAFLEVFPEGYSMETITHAIAEFERTLNTPNSRFDRHLAGDEIALTDEEKKGYQLFKDYRCATCHVGRLLGGQSFEKMGLKADYFGDRGNVGTADFGRFNVTGKEEDRFRLKVPTLRNIAFTFPYLHDGSTSDLKEVVEIMVKYQVGKTITDIESDLIVKFFHTLNGELHGEMLQ